MFTPTKLAGELGISKKITAEWYDPSAGLQGLIFGSYFKRKVRGSLITETSCLRQWSGV